MDFLGVFDAGSSVYNFKDNLFKFRRNKDDDNICDLTRVFFDIPNSKKGMGISSVHIKHFPKIQKNLKICFIKNRKFAKPPCQITHLLVVSIE